MNDDSERPSWNSPYADETEKDYIERMSILKTIFYQTFYEMQGKSDKEKDIILKQLAKQYPELEHELSDVDVINGLFYNDPDILNFDLPNSIAKYNLKVEEFNKIYTQAVKNGNKVTAEELLELRRLEQQVTKAKNVFNEVNKKFKGDMLEAYRSLPARQEPAPNIRKYSGMNEFPKYLSHVEGSLDVFKLKEEKEKVRVRDILLSPQRLLEAIKNNLPGQQKKNRAMKEEYDRAKRMNNYMNNTNEKPKLDPIPVPGPWKQQFFPDVSPKNLPSSYSKSSTHQMPKFNRGLINNINSSLGELTNGGLSNEAINNLKDKYKNNNNTLETFQGTVKHQPTFTHSTTSNETSNSMDDGRRLPRTAFATSQFSNSDYGSRSTHDRSQSTIKSNEINIEFGSTKSYNHHQNNNKPDTLKYKGMESFVTHVSDVSIPNTSTRMSSEERYRHQPVTSFGPKPATRYGRH